MKIIDFRFPRQPKSKQFIKNSLCNHHTKSYEFCTNMLSAINTNKQNPIDAITSILTQNNIQHLLTILQYYNRYKAVTTKEGKKMEGECENIKSGYTSKYRNKIEEKNLEIKNLHQKIRQLKAQIERKNRKINTLIREYQNWHIQKSRHELLGNIGSYEKYWKSFNTNLITCQPVKMGSSELCGNKRLTRKQYRTKKINKYRSHQSIEQIQKNKTNRNNIKIENKDNKENIRDMDDLQNMNEIDETKKTSRNVIKTTDKVIKQQNLNGVLFETDKLITSEDLICETKFNEANSRNQIDGIKTCTENNSQKQINDRNSDCQNMDVSDCSDFPQEMFI